MSDKMPAPGAWLQLPDETTLDEETQALLAKARRNVGFLPNVLATYRLRPERLRKWIRHFNEVMRGESALTPTEREMIAVVVSVENHCLYCLVSHGAELRVLLGDPILAETIAFDYRRAGLDDRALAMLDYAVKISQRPVECSEADIDHLRGLGFADETIFDIAETAALYNFTNRLASAVGMMPNREYYGMGREGKI
jgi:uncharacterized peroxidase-related enzyme